MQLNKHKHVLLSLRGKRSVQENTGRVERFSIVNRQPKPDINPSAQNLTGI